MDEVYVVRNYETKTGKQKKKKKKKKYIMLLSSPIKLQKHRSILLNEPWNNFSYVPILYKVVLFTSCKRIKTVTRILKTNVNN